MDLIPGEIFRVQSEIAEHVAEALNVTLLERERTALAAHPTENLDAYEAYLLGRFYWNKRQGEDIRRAAEYFQQAIAADSAFALGYTGLADAYNVFYSYGIDDLPQQEVGRRAEAVARRALELDPDLAEAHASLGSALITWFNFDESDREFQMAIELDPDYAVAHYWYAESLMARMRLEEALAHMETAVALEPASPIVHHLHGFTLMRMGRVDEAVAAARKALELEPGFRLPHSILFDAYWKRGRLDGMELEMLAFGFPQPVVSVIIGYTRGEIDTETAARKLITFAAAAPEPPRLTTRATVLSWVGARDQALDLLEEAYRDRNPSLWTLRIISAFRSLDGDPRFERILLGLGLKQPGES